MSVGGMCVREREEQGVREEGKKDAYLAIVPETHGQGHRHHQQMASNLSILIDTNSHQPINNRDEYEYE